MGPSAVGRGPRPPLNRALRQIAILVAAFALLVSVGWAAGRLAVDALGTADVRWVEAAARGRTATLSALARGVTWLGSTPAAVAVALVAVVTSMVLRRRHLVIAALAIVPGLFVDNVIKALVDRPRPSIVRLAEATGSSFPSGHAAAAAVTFGVVALLVCRLGRRRCAAAWAVALLVAGAVAWTRVYLGVHYPTDVVAGALLGLAWVGAVAVALRSGGEEPDEARSIRSVEVDAPG